MFYTGIGSRRTPQDTLLVMRVFARTMAAKGWTLRSGGADGADTAFHRGAGAKSVVYLPWHGFAKAGDCGVVCPMLGDRWVEAMRLAASVHPTWSRLSKGARALHARNCFQVLGDDLSTPSAFVLCWTPSGEEAEADCTADTGGTATAIRLADRYRVPVFNLCRVGALQRLALWF